MSCFKKLSLSATSAAALAATFIGALTFSPLAAQAADLPYRKAAPAAPVYLPPVFTWAGFYIGANAGYNFTDSNGDVLYNPGALPGSSASLLPGSYDIGKDGFTGGAQAGYNYQINQYVFGLETDINYVDSKESNSYSGATFIPGIGTIGGFSTTQGELSYLGTVRGRLGYAFDRTLLYVTGGLAYGEVKGSSSFSVPALGANWAGSKSDTRAGYTIGGGVEYALTNNWSLKGEYLYYDLGKDSYTAGPINPAAAATGASYNIRQETKGNIVRAGLNYRF